MDDTKRENIFHVLGDKRCRDIIDILGKLERPISAEELSEELEIPKSTTYRKLELLRETPLVEQELEIDQGGHHREHFKLVVDELIIELVNGLSIVTMKTEK